MGHDTLIDTSFVTAGMRRGLIHPQCTVCRGEAWRDPFYYVWRDQRWWLFRCQRCTHQFIYPSVGTAREVCRSVFLHQRMNGGTFSGSYEENEGKLRREACEALTLVLTVVPDEHPLQMPGGFSGGLFRSKPTGLRLLDIGCAGGTFLDEARLHGYLVRGIEPNATMAEYARTTYDLDVLTGRIEDIPPGQYARQYHVVTMLDVLEHIPDPLTALSKACRWLVPGGTIFIRGPLANSRWSKAKEWLRRSFLMPKQLPGYPLDANHFNVRSLEACLHVAGFRNIVWHTKRHDFGQVSATKRRES